MNEFLMTCLAVLYATCEVIAACYIKQMTKFVLFSSLFNCKNFRTKGCISREINLFLKALIKLDFTTSVFAASNARDNFRANETEVESIELNRNET